MTRQPRRAPHHAMQATTSEGLAEGLYVAVRVGFESATLRLQGGTYHGATTLCEHVT